MSYNLGFIGGGNMSTAIFKGITLKNTHPPEKVWVSGPNIDNLKLWKEMGANTTSQNGEVLKHCSIVFLGVKPGLLGMAITEGMAHYVPNGNEITFVSMLAGVTIKQLEEVLRIHLKHVKVIKIMPNMPMALGAGACIYTPNANVSKEDCDALENLLTSCGICEKVPENMMNSLGVLSGCGPAFIYTVIEALADGAVKQGVPRALALRFAAAAAAGGGAAARGGHPAVLRDQVCSPGGSTIAGVAALEEGGLRSALIKAVEASTRRTEELGKEKK